eukprot:Lithocolla_globosa_v1_NODE_1113_length_2859_cov_12.694365.p1 type:complete len:369 gc:universal NODE_1113_length_2859_cov_12.694365:254-1360(+)
MFIPLWRLWMDIHIFLNRFDTKDVFTKLLMFWFMGCVVLMAASAQNCFKSTGKLFICSYLAARLALAFVYLSFIPLIRKIRASLSILSAGLFLTSIAWFVALAHVHSPTQSYAMGAAIVVDLGWHFGGIQLTYYLMRTRYRLAYNIEHFVERFGLFTVLALGEIVFGVSYIADDSKLDVYAVRSLLALLICYNFKWLYFDVDASRMYTHALRRNFLTKILFPSLHLPLHMGIVINGHATGYFVRETVHDTDRWLLFVSSACILSILGCMAMLNKSHDRPDETYFPKWFRVLCRFFAALTLIFLPLTQLGQTQCLLVVAVVTLLSVIIEEYGGLRRARVQNFKETVSNFLSSTQKSENGLKSKEPFRHH